MIDLKKDKQKCSKCGKLLDVGIEFHGPRQCLEYAATIACSLVLPSPPWQFYKIDENDGGYEIVWIMGGYNHYLVLYFSKEDYRQNIFSITTLLQSWLERMRETIV